MSDAYRNGRLGKDPATFWYEGELGFLDHYIVPLAMKLKDCGVFGVSSDEFLDYARANRQEWQRKGEAIVADYVGRYNQSRRGSARRTSNHSIVPRLSTGSTSSSRRDRSADLLASVAAVIAEE
jgi:hypothetical protein